MSAYAFCTLAIVLEIVNSCTNIYTHVIVLHVRVVQVLVRTCTFRDFFFVCGCRVPRGRDLGARVQPTRKKRR